MNVTTLQPNSLKISTTDVTTWKIDPDRSTASFAVANRFMQVMNITVNGAFSAVNGTIFLDESSMEQSRAEITIEAATVDTGMAKRDAHLKAADFFNVQNYPHIKFLSTSIKAVDRARGDYQVNGLLTIRNVSHAITFDLLVSPPKPGEREPRMVLSGEARIDRREFGLGRSKPPMSKPAHEVSLSISIEAIRSE